MTRVAGVDGTKGGWVAVELEEGRFVRDRLLAIDTAFEELAAAEVIGIDIPIGFGPREADRAARKFLAGSASTVFTTPSQAILASPFGPGLGVSAHAHALGPRVIQVTELARGDSRLREVHPEVSFRAMNGGRPLGYRKKSAGGALERLSLLEREGIDVRVAEAAAAPLDDVLDAAAAAWSAHRIAAGIAKTLPDPPEDVDSSQVAIWY